MTDKEKNFVSAVIYVHNQAANIEQFLRMVSGVLINNFEHAEIICVNDDSSDGSDTVIRNISKEFKNTSITIVNMSCYHGLELSMNAGTNLSIGDFVFEFDNCISDFTEEDMMRVYRRALEGYDIVSATADRKIRFSSRFFYWLYNRFSVNNQEKIGTESFRILSRRVINRVLQMNRSVPYRKVVYQHSGLMFDKITYNPVQDVRFKDSRKESAFKWELAIDSLIMFTDFGYRMSLFMALLMLIIIAAAVIYTFFAYIFSNPVEGWTSTILFLSVVFFGLFVILTIIIKHLQIIMRMIFKRQQYTVLSVEKTTK